MTQKNKYEEIKKQLEDEYSSVNERPLASYNKTAKDHVYWYCAKCDEDFPAAIRKRIYDNSGCPRCARKKSKVPLSEEFPHLLKDYDTEKNEKPLDYYSRGCEDRVWWKCHECGDERQVIVKTRAGKGHGCKICTTNKEMARRNRLLIEKEGSLKDRAPHIAAQWDYDKNDTRPEDYTWQSGASVHWKCEYGHEWKTEIKSRVANNAGCRKCGNHNSQYEMRLFAELRIFDSEIKWNSRLDGIECDILLPSLGIAVEVDGYPWHDSAASRQKDLEKNRNLKSQGIEVIRYRDSQLQPLTKNEVTYKHQGDQFPSFIKLLHILKRKCKSGEIKSEIKRYIDEKDSFINEEIFKDLYFRSGKTIHRKSLAEEYPEIAKYWSSKNYPLTAEQVYSRGKKIVWWKCEKCGIDYELMVKERTRKETLESETANGCPCGGTKVVNDKNNLIAQRGESVKDFWDYEKNDSDPSDYRPYSREEVWFKCRRGHSFKEQIVKVWGNKRNKKIRCGVCKDLFFIEKNNNDNLLAKRGKSVKTYWDYDKNDLDPQDYTPASQSEVWFRCPDGHSFREKIIKLWGNHNSKSIRCRVCDKFFPIEKS